MKRLFPSLPDSATLGTVFQTFPRTVPPLSDFHNRVMREDGVLPVGERELIAAYVSGLNACKFCFGAHQVHARAFGIDPSLIEALMEDPETAPVDPGLRPILAYVAKLTLNPTKMVEADARAVYEAGWSEEALYEAIVICAMFCMMNRILEGTGITEYYADPKTVDEESLDRLRSPTVYADFPKTLGITD